LRIRSTSDPWAILVAEVMAQQTQISRVDEAWVGFMKRYPGSAELATASTADVLRDWAGLGYNRRALALQRTAQLIETRHDGRVPDDIEALEALPGVGPYTARAVAAVAFGQAVAPVDTNIRRVVSRLVGVPMSVAELQATADWLVASDDPATWTHASMDLGATVCRSRRPRCDQCPISRSCESAGSVQPSPRMNGEAVPFELTTRWLRGRIVERLRDAEADDWVALPDSIGSHDHEHVAAAVASLERDGLLERRHDGSVRLPSSQT
jgi:A/G-specific adenine glycosylase